MTNKTKLSGKRVGMSGPWTWSLGCLLLIPCGCGPARPYSDPPVAAAPSNLAQREQPSEAPETLSAPGDDSDPISESPVVAREVQREREAPLLIPANEETVPLCRQVRLRVAHGLPGLKGYRDQPIARTPGVAQRERMILDLLVHPTESALIWSDQIGEILIDDANYVFSVMDHRAESGEREIGVPRRASRNIGLGLWYISAQDLTSQLDRSHELRSGDYNFELPGHPFVLRISLRLHDGSNRQMIVRFRLGKEMKDPSKV